MTSSGFIEVEGGELFYRSDGAGPPVVCVHGAPVLDHRVWNAQIEELSRSHEVVRYDLRGYGLSTVPTGPYRHCDDLAALIRGLELTAPTLCGLSFGGTVALDTVLTHPDLISD